MASIFMAIGLFVVLPHLFSMGMEWLGLSGDVDGLSFIWDGFFKLPSSRLFCAFLCADSRVFQYHGAEHMVIGAFEFAFIQKANFLRKKQATLAACTLVVAQLLCFLYFLLLLCCMLS